MPLVRPRLNDYFGLPFTQEEVTFAIPFLDEDLPLYVDPFLLWKSPSQQDNSLHTSLITSFNHIGREYSTGKKKEAIKKVIYLSECDEVGLGSSASRKGKPIGEKLANKVLELFTNIPTIQKDGLQHIETVQLLVHDIAKDRISDFTCSILKSFLIDYTISQCTKYDIPCERVTLELYDYKTSSIIKEELDLPINPATGQAVLLIPRRWLRFMPWLNYEDYFQSHVSNLEGKGRVEILDYNRANYGQVLDYINKKEEVKSECSNDPMFSQIPVVSMKRSLNSIHKLPTGKTDNADRQYEDTMCKMLASLLYPQLDFAQAQSRTVSNIQIRDLIFYNNRSFTFLKDIYDEFSCKQLVIELKNVNKVERDHINQLNRYLTDQFGRFGIIFTRNKPTKNIFQNTIDLWSGQRRCILIMDDTDLDVMTQVFESKQRLPIEVVKAKYIEFIRSCPA
jgi:hypothetical protein